jgi:hypothetical protein
MTEERRRFKRITFDAHTSMTQGQHAWTVKLLDLSLKGLLVERPDGWQGNPEAPFDVTIDLGEETLAMQAELRHDNNGQLGFQCMHIDVDSITHLRRLVELNLGDEAALERELSALIG